VSLGANSGLTTAGDYTQSAGTTRLTASLLDGRSVLAVEDEGPGIAPGMEVDIFDRDVSTAGSTGLGLPLARALVEADGGRLVLASSRPARFEILIPRPRVPEACRARG
jgi:signal transduction histidine kinase